MCTPKVISQETFDMVVLENVVDFDKTLDEAVADAVQEFGAQGVLLTNIIKDLSLSSDEENKRIIHPVLVSLEELKSKPSNLKSVLNSMETECQRSLPHRTLAAKDGAYEELMRVMNEVTDDAEVLSSAVLAMQSLTDGNPDILTPEGVVLMMQLMDKYKSDYQSDVMLALAKWCHSCNLKHEANRERIFEAKIPHSLVESLSGVSSVPHKIRIINTLRALRSFTLDDDIRTEFGKAHENCRYLVEEEKLISVALTIIRDAILSSSGIVAGECLSAIASVCVRAEYCQQAYEADALEVINSILVSFIDTPVLCKQSITLLSTLAGDDKVKVAVMKNKTPYLIAQAMDKHQMHLGVSTASCSAVSMLSLRHPQHAQQLMDSGAVRCLLQAMKLHTKEKQLQKLACLAIRNLCSRSPAIAATLKEMQAEDLVKTAVSTHGAAVKDLAKSALRDLGAEVELVEQWHGKGHEIDA